MSFLLHLSLLAEDHTSIVILVADCYWIATSICTLVGRHSSGHAPAATQLDKRMVLYVKWHLDLVDLKCMDCKETTHQPQYIHLACMLLQSN